jgi:DNA-binding response OmpR family regulator
VTGQRILVVEDEQSISEVVALYLGRAGYAVSVAHDGHEALRHLTDHLPALVILDVMLPGVDGLEIARRLRRTGETPIILLTSRSGEQDRIEGLELGADDYVTKPFSPQELVSRVRAVLRRAQGADGGAGTGGSSQPLGAERSTGAQPPLTYPALTLEPATRTVRARGRTSLLTQRECDLLYLLAAEPRRVFTRAELLRDVWGETDYIDPTTVTVHVRRLREKIESDPSNPRHIQTVWGVGYRFEP